LEFNSGGSGDILYAKLMKEEILKCDKELLKAAKQAGSIGGMVNRNKSAKIMSIYAIRVSHPNNVRYQYPYPQSGKNTIFN
jgi:hypothetical protein